MTVYRDLLYQSGKKSPVYKCHLEIQEKRRGGLMRKIGSDSVLNEVQIFLMAPRISANDPVPMTETCLL